MTTNRKKKKSLKLINDARIILEIESEVKGQLEDVANKQVTTLSNLLRLIIKNYLKKNSK
jgi:N-acetyl-anhydromuramyl-L-alanine amidase AmpD